MIKSMIININNQQTMALYEQILTQWSLTHYVKIFENEFFDDVELWDELKKWLPNIKIYIMQKRGPIVTFQSNIIYSKMIIKRAVKMAI